MKVLFISHDASRTGAPMVLLHLMRWLKSNTDVKFDTLLINGGELTEDFKSIGDVYTYQKPYNPVIFVRLIRKIKKHLKLSNKSIFHQFKNNNYDIIYGNTVVTNKYLKEAKTILNKPTILHVHELNTVIEFFCGNNFAESKDYIDHFIACSKIVKENLEKKHSIRNVTLIHSFVSDIIKIETTKEEMKKQLKIPEDSIVIGGCGSLDWRKGVDFFIHIAKNVLTKNSNVVFVWLGGDLDTTYAKQYIYDIKKLGIHKTLMLAGSQPNPQDYFNLFDIFLMTSREDPFPLVCIENALQRNPIICFNEGVGSSEYIENTVPYLDIKSMSNAVQKYIDDPKLRAEDGNRLRNNVKQFTIDNSANKVLSLLQSISE